MSVLKSLGILTITLSATLARAGDDDRRPLREVKSDNESCVLRIEPGKPDRDKPKSCTATLISTGRAADGERQKWERPLVNDVAPAAAAVRDDARFVVTLGEFRRGGARHALVIYGERGQLLRHFVLSDLLAREDWKRVETSRRSIDWLDGADYGFDDPERFVIRLKSDREIVIDLKTLRIVRPAQHGGEDADDGDIPPEMLALLSDNADDRTARLAALAEKMGTTPENLERLIEQGYVNPEKLEEVELTDAESDTPPTTTNIAALDANGVTPDPAPATDKPQAAVEPVLVKPLVPVDPPADMPLAVPAPDPANRVNYLDWVNAMAETPGPNAAPDIEAAIGALQEWEGDQALFDAAMAGDAAALEDPAIVGWLEANQDALAHSRAATTKEFAGWQLHSEDGSMMGALLPALAPQRQLARAAVMDGKRLEQGGDYEQAAQRYLDTVAAGAQTGQGPTLIENLVGIAVQNLGSEALFDLASHDSERKIDYASLAARADEAYQSVRPMEEAVQFERASMMDAIQRTFGQDPDTGEYRINPQSAMQFMSMAGSGEDGGQLQTLAKLATVKFDDTVIQANAYYDALTEASRLPYQDARTYMGELEKQLEAPNTNIMIKALLPALSRAHFGKTRAETQRRASLLTTHLMAYRQKNGQLPDSLAEFAGRDFATDPFTGATFAYRREGDDFVLYSLADNGVDDGGVHDPKAETGDVVYWPRPAKP